jgi:hypothetical protein
MTAQELFDTVATHLITQNKQSLSPDGVCKYRGAGGLKCAIGVLIPDDKYKTWMDCGGNALHLVLETIGLGEHFYLCRKLQVVHDATEPHEWRGELSNVAAKFGLQYEHK